MVTAGRGGSELVDDGCDRVKHHDAVCFASVEDVKLSTLQRYGCRVPLDVVLGPLRQVGITVETGQPAHGVHVAVDGALAAARDT